MTEDKRQWLVQGQFSKRSTDGLAVGAHAIGVDKNGAWVALVRGLPIAKTIVAKLNSHDDLVAALKEARDIAQIGDGRYVRTLIIKAINAALKKAGAD
jgi:hypothetical protein